MPKDKHFFTLLEKSVVEVELTKSQKKNLIRHLSTHDIEKKLVNVGEESIRSLQICHNNTGELLPLCNLIGRKYTIPEWLSAYQIKEEDYFFDESEEENEDNRSEKDENDEKEENKIYMQKIKYFATSSIDKNVFREISKIFALFSL